MLAIGLEGTQREAGKLADMLIAGDCVSLQGDLGAGKTAFVQHMLRHLHGDDVAVISPTFNLLQTYDVTLATGEETTIWHYDLYRLESANELQELGLEDALASGVTFIEWPEIAMDWLPKDRIAVQIEFTESNDNRELKIDSIGDNITRLKIAGLWWQ